MKCYLQLPRRISFVYPFLVGLLPTLLLGACTALPAVIDEQTTSPVTLTVSAAASLQPVLEAIAPFFNEAHPDIAVEFNFASSGALQRQIEQGASVDLFFPAAVQQMDDLEKRGLVLPESRRDVVGNCLVLIAPTNSQLKIERFAQLGSVDIDRIAVGEFRSVPAGQYAQQVFKALGLLDPLRSKFVFGNTVRSVLSAVESGNVDLGVVYATDAALSSRVNVVAIAPSNSHSAIVYPIAIVRTSFNPKAAQAFIDFLITEQVQTRFKAFGFEPL